MSQKQNIDCSDLFESAANEAKRLKWNRHISAANFELKRLHEHWVEEERKVRNKKERIILELAENLEKDDMPREYILEEMIRGLCPEPKEGEEPETYVDVSYLRRVLRRGKYELIEESTLQSRDSPANDDKNNPKQKTVTIDAATGEEVYEPATTPPRPSVEVKRLQTQLAEKVKELEESRKRVADLQGAQDITDIPEIVDNKIGPVKVQNLSKISDFDRRGYKILSSRFAELIKRKLEKDNQASIKFYVIAKDKSTNVESLVPVSFVVNMKDKTTDLILDESRL